MIESEAAVLGACLVDPQAYWKIADTLTAGDFSTAEGRDLFDTIARQCREGLPCDGLTIGEVSRHGNLAMQVASGSGWRSTNVASYAALVAARAMARKVKAAGQRITQLPDADSYGEAQRILATCAPRSSNAIRSIREYLRESISQMQVRVDAGGNLTGIPTSLPALDDLTAGFQAGDLIILAARPSVGKTALAVQCAIHAAKAGTPVLFFSLEMSGVQLADRVQAHMSGVDSAKIRTPSRMDEADFSRLFAVAGDIADLPLLIDESSGLAIEAIEARARQTDATNRLGLIVIDYLTQITPPKANSTNDAMQIITRRLKALAKDLRVPVVLLSQLNRAGDAKPGLTALRDSGAIEQDADVVAFLHRPNPEQHRTIELIVEKQRNGPTGVVWLYADYPLMRFTESEAPRVDEQPVRQRWGKVVNR